MQGSNETSSYLLIDSRVLPDVFRKVVEAKRLIATGQARSSSEAVRMVDISRSAFYKYKDAVYPYSSRDGERLLSIYTQLKDETGVLSHLLQFLSTAGANILTINQNIPIDGVAPVSISVRTNDMVLELDELLEQIRQMPGVVEVRILSGH